MPRLNETPIVEALLAGQQILAYNPNEPDLDKRLSRLAIELFKGEPGNDGADGTNGVDGATIHYGEGVPSDTLGKEDDFYIDTLNGIIASKQGGTYVALFSLIGPAGADGSDGADGTNGKDGSNGADGATIRNGTTAPANSLGKAGDYFINTTTQDLYFKASTAYAVLFNLKGLKGDKGDAGADGGPGTPGADGSILRNGTANPANNVGNNGDYFLNTATQDMLFKAAGVYTVLFNLKGAKGDTGTSGTNGATIRNGAGAPSAALGANGDYYINNTSFDLYTKAGGSYSILFNLRGAKGDTGPGVPTGGTANQALVKNSSTDFDTKWIDFPTGGGASNRESKLFAIKLAMLSSTIYYGATMLADDFKTSAGIKGSSAGHTYDGTNFLVKSSSASSDPTTTGLFHFDGADNAQSAVDDTGAITFTFGGASAPVLKTAQKKFGTASLYFDGTASCYMDTPSNAAISLAADFTIETFAYMPTTASGAFSIFDFRTSGGARFVLAVVNGKLYILEEGNGIVNRETFGPSTVAANTWHHVAVSRSGTTLRVFLNGNLEITTTNNISYNGHTLRIGANILNASAKYVGYLDEMRISNGTARYTTGFTPPAAAFSLGSQDLTLIGSNYATYTVPTKASVSLLVKSTNGAITPNTNLKASISRDGGTTFSDVVLAATWLSPTGYTLYESEQVSLTSQPSGSSLCYRIVANRPLTVEIDAVEVDWA